MEKRYIPTMADARRVRRTLSVLGLLVSWGCKPADPGEAGEHEPADDKDGAPETKADRDRNAPDGNTTSPTPADDGADGADGAAESPVVDLLEYRRLADAYLAGSKPDDMVKAKRLIVDASGLGEAQLVGYMLIPGHLPEGAMTTGETLENARKGREKTRLTALAEQDRARPAMWADVDAGDYTVCVDPADDAKRMLFPRDQAPLCKTISVADDVTSRVVEFEK